MHLVKVCDDKARPGLRVQLQPWKKPSPACSLSNPEDID